MSYRLSHRFSIVYIVLTDKFETHISKEIVFVKFALIHHTFWASTVTVLISMREDHKNRLTITLPCEELAVFPEPPKRAGVRQEERSLPGSDSHPRKVLKSVTCSVVGMACLISEMVVWGKGVSSLLINLSRGLWLVNLDRDYHLVFLS